MKTESEYIEWFKKKLLELKPIPVIETEQAVLHIQASQPLEEDKESDQYIKST
ncbi:hypothetical protein [Bacillus marasmi]|uniref:hypothetical protein n=1 Tax=Bacillus marasmi TaxID=1926279 RepID=UPI00164CEEB6|nr:hypothetical protein [Bacillus marasmi]